MRLSRRTFVCGTSMAACATCLPQIPASARIGLTSAERDAVLRDAAVVIDRQPRTIRSIPSPAKDASSSRFYSDGDPIANTGFRAHAESLADASEAIASLTAAYVLTAEDRYALAAGRHLWTWFVAPDSRMDPTFESAGRAASGDKPSPDGILDAVPLAEIARSLQFLVDTAALSPPDLITAKAWFRDLIAWMTADRTALLARDSLHHTASAWLLIVSAAARLLADSATLDDCRRRFKRPTLRNQLDANGHFVHEIQTAYPYRNSLFNLDMLAGVCELLSTPFSTPWTDELEDGPGMRSAIAFLFPFIKDQPHWPYLADADHYREVPRKRPALLFAGRAYARPEYVDLWKSLPPVPLRHPLRSTLPIRQPLLWISRAPHAG